MPELTNEQHAELNAWIAENVFGGLPELPSHPDNPVIALAECPKFTTSPADAMAVLEKCAEKCGQVKVNHPNVTASGLWFVSDMDNDARAKGDTLAYAICLFARQLFSVKEAAK